MNHLLYISIACISMFRVLFSPLPIDCTSDYIARTQDTIIIKSELEMMEVAVDSSSQEIIRPTSIIHAPKIFNYDQLGMFCKFDHQLDKGSKMQLRFRLGTLQAVDQKERKGPTTTVIDP